MSDTLQLFGISIDFHKDNVDVTQTDSNCYIMIDGLKYPGKTKFIAIPNFCTIKIHNKKTGLSANIVNRLIFLNVRNKHYFE
jgi:hypothetical protein